VFSSAVLLLCPVTRSVAQPADTHNETEPEPRAGPELTLDQMPNPTGLFAGDIVTEYHQVFRAFGESTATQALLAKVVQYDASLDEPDDQDTTAANDWRQLGAIKTDGVALWPGGVVPYTIGKSFGSKTDDLVVLRDAMDQITQRTGITFRQHGGEDDPSPSISFENGSGCSSSIGMSPNKGTNSQALTLKGSSLLSPASCRTVGVTVHELCHVSVGDTCKVSLLGCLRSIFSFVHSFLFVLVTKLTLTTHPMTSHITAGTRHVARAVFCGSRRTP
jgi:hypothetical protein